ncbi:Glu-tRNA(Gln) amidotransferase subunit GatD [Candidatus Woesearchaeota archaeon]|nr:Glu-tRNA(Gln) amidotransferase subunit GatD [Candidatus Woesearchaeota archaeon]
MASTGDRVKIKTSKETIEGILMPNPDKKIVMIKLDNGYNIGLEKKLIQSTKVIKKKKETKSNAKKVKNKKGLPTITILHCGGTIASKVDYETGAVKAKFKPEELLEMFPELGKIANVQSRLVANMMSENMRFAHYNSIAKEVEKEVKNNTQGIIITHGTDTLHYTAAALAFILEDLPIPVILVGSQRSSDRGSSDAFLNLKCAAQFIAKANWQGVAICMHASAEDGKCAILSATKSRKMHSSRRDAFQTINGEEIALVSDEIKWTKKPSKKESKLKVKLFKENIKVGLIKAHPQMFAEELKVFENFDGLILEGTGLGHFPIEVYDSKTKEHDLILKEIQKLTKKIPVAMTTQTIFGGVNMNVYSPGRKLVELGVLGNGSDITAETALIKLGWLLSNHPKELQELWKQNLRGELGSRRNYQKDFLKQ